MTLPLTDEQKTLIRVALAKWAGMEVQNFFSDGDGTLFMLDEWESVVEVPNYPASLDDCHRIEVKLTDEQYREFENHLREMTSRTLHIKHVRDMLSASAEHRALALYQTICNQ